MDRRPQGVWGGNAVSDDYGGHRRRRYLVRAYSLGTSWSVSVFGLNGARAEVRAFNRIPSTARSLIALILDVDPESFDLDLEVSGERWAS